MLATSKKMKIDRIKIDKWRQFENIELNLHPQLTILTGSNGAGKTTILNIINRHFGWQTEIVGTPKQDKKTGNLKFLSGLWNLFGDKDEKTAQIPNSQVSVGEINYDNKIVCKLTVPEYVSTTYNLNLNNQQGVVGLHIPSHRPVYKYQKVANISTQLITRQQAYNQYNNTKRNRYNGAGGNSENFHIKETLISLATFGYGNQVVSKNEIAISLFEGFEEVLKKILPPKLGFEKISVRIPEVVLVTKSGDFSLDAVSGGVASIIDLAWQLYMFEAPNGEFMVTLDEPENHLHPEMQKTLLPNFLKAFPKIQFVVATHNPFIITSVAESNVYALNYNDKYKVSSLFLESFEKSGTANEVLREVLGMETTMPKWIDEKIDSVISKYASSGITQDNLIAFKNDLKEIGLDKYVSTSVAQLIEKSKKND